LWSKAWEEECIRIHQEEVKAWEVECTIAFQQDDFAEASASNLSQTPDTTRRLAASHLDTTKPRRKSLGASNSPVSSQTNAKPKAETKDRDSAESLNERGGTAVPRRKSKTLIKIESTTEFHSPVKVRMRKKVTADREVDALPSAKQPRSKSLTRRQRSLGKGQTEVERKTIPDDRQSSSAKKQQDNPEGTNKSIRKVLSLNDFKKTFQGQHIMDDDELSLELEHLTGPDQGPQGPRKRSANRSSNTFNIYLKNLEDSASIQVLSKSNKSFRSVKSSGSQSLVMVPVARSKSLGSKPKRVPAARKTTDKNDDYRPSTVPRKKYISFNISNTSSEPLKSSLRSGRFNPKKSPAKFVESEHLGQSFSNHTASTTSMSSAGDWSLEELQ